MAEALNTHRRARPARSSSWPPATTAPPRRSARPAPPSEALTVGSVDDPIGRALVLLEPGTARALGRAEARAHRPRQRRHRRPLGRQRRRGLVHRDERHLDGDAARRRRRRDPQAAASRVHRRRSCGPRSSAPPTDVGLHLVPGRHRASSTSSAAIDAPVIASGSGDFGMLTWGEEPTPVVRTIEYTNRSDAEVTVASATWPTPRLGGDRARTAVGRRVRRAHDGCRQLTIPAGETRSRRR